MTAANKWEAEARRIAIRALNKFHATFERGEEVCHRCTRLANEMTIAREFAPVIQQRDKALEFLGCLVGILEMAWNEHDKQIPEFREAKQYLAERKALLEGGE